MRSLCFAILVLYSFASSAEIFRGPRSSGAGGTGIAGVMGAEGALLNPAMVPLYKGSTVGAYFRDGYVDSAAHKQGWGFGALDNGPEVWFPGAIHYVRTRETAAGVPAANGELWHVALGERVSENFAVGFTAYRLVHKTDLDSYEQWNGGMGLMFMVNPELGFGYTLNSILGTSARVPTGLKEPLEQGVGAMVGFGEELRMRGDIRHQVRDNPHNHLTTAFGVESKTEEFFVVRAGYRYEGVTARSVWTAGLGFDGPKLKANYAFEKNQERTSGALHSVDLSIPF